MLLVKWVVRLRVACDGCPRRAQVTPHNFATSQGMGSLSRARWIDGRAQCRLAGKPLYADVANARTERHYVGRHYYSLSVAMLHESNCPSETPTGAVPSGSSNQSYFLVTTKIEPVPELYACALFNAISNLGLHACCHMSYGSVVGAVRT